MQSVSLIIIALFCLIVQCHGFTMRSRVRIHGTKSLLEMTKLNYNGKIVDFPPGSPLSAACTKLGIKPKYSCKKGECASCTISVAGNLMRPCVAKVPPEPKLKSLIENGLKVSV